MSASRELAQAVHRRAMAVTNVHTPQALQLATIRRLRPLQVEMHGSADVLTAPDDVMLSQFVRWFDLNFQLQVGDVLTLMEAADGWLAFDVVSQRDMGAGVRPGKTPDDPEADMEPAAPSTEQGLLDVTVSVDVPTNPDGTVAGPATANATVAWNRHIAHKLEVRDVDGNLIGFVPVFEDLP